MKAAYQAALTELLQGAGCKDVGVQGPSSCGPEASCTTLSWLWTGSWITNAWKDNRIQTGNLTGEGAGVMKEVVEMRTDR